MTAINSAAFFNDARYLPTATELALLADYDRAQGNVKHAEKHTFPPACFPWKHDVFTSANGNTKSSAVFAVPFPTKVWAADLACETSAGSSATMDVVADPAGATTFATILTSSTTDVHTAAGTAQRAAVLSGSEELVRGTTLKVTCTAGGSGAVVGAQAILWCQRL